MDSSRSGLLSTLIMTIPLIVVPALALLRPPAPDAGPSATRLDASSDSEDDMFEDFPELTEIVENPSPDLEFSPKPGPASHLAAAETDREEAADPFAEFFPEPAVERAPPASRQGPLDPRLSAPAAPASLPSQLRRQEQPTPKPETAASAALSAAADASVTAIDSVVSADAAASAELALLQQLRKLGTTKTFWFSPGAGAAGFVALLPGEKENVSYRFEAVSSSRVESVRQVHDQVTRWRDGRRRSANALPSATEKLKN